MSTITAYASRTLDPSDPITYDPASQLAYIVGLEREVARLTAALEGARVASAPKPRKARKPKVSPCVAGLLKVKFTAGVTIKSELGEWMRAMDEQHGRLHGPATRAEAHLSSAVVKRRPARIEGPLLVHDGNAIHDEKTARQYVKAL